jgi:hypothetical protein
MADDPNITPPAPAPPTTEPPKAAVPVVDASKARAEAEYYARHPEQLDATLRQLEQAGVIDVRNRVEDLQRRIDQMEVIAETGLSKEDIQFITAPTREEMVAKAAAFKARLGAAAPPPPAGATNEQVVPIPFMGRGIKPVEATPVIAPAPPAPPAISEVVVGRGGKPSVEAAEAALYKSMEGVKFES